jgi:ELWxxDGT repeat protein
MRQLVVAIALCSALLGAPSGTLASSDLYVKPTATADAAGCHGLDVWNGSLIINTIPPDDGTDTSFPECAYNGWSVSLPSGRLIFDWVAFGDNSAAQSDVRSSDGNSGGLRLLGTFGGLRCSVPQKPVVVGQTAYLKAGCLGGDTYTATNGLRSTTFGLPGGNVGPLTPVGNRVVYAALAKWGREPFVSDGTRTGSHLLKDIWPGAHSSGPQDFVSRGSYATFSADDGNGRARWWTNGTPEGTHKVRAQ